MFWHHLVYFIISLALLGFGISGTWLSFGEQTRIARMLTTPRAAVGFLLATLLSCFLIPTIWATTNADFTDIGELAGLVAVYSVAVLPYFFAGWILGRLYRDCADRVHAIYFADLTGAALGCLSFLALIHPLGAARLVVLATSLVVLPVFILCPGSWRYLRIGVAGAVLLCMFLKADLFEASIVPHSSKGFHLQFADLPPGEEKVVELTEWNTLCRTDVVGATNQEQKLVFIDGDAYTPLAVHHKTVPPRPFALDEPLVPNAVPYLLDPNRESVLVLGSGGGGDVYRALRAGATWVDAVEINPTTARIVKGEYRDQIGGLFDDPAVHLWNEEGRSFVRQSKRNYDVVMIHAIDTFAAMDSGAYVLAENYLYTVEAMKDYFNRLTPTGVLCITRWDYAGETPRLFAVMLEALYELGVEHPDKHILAASRVFWTAILISPTPFTAEHVLTVRENAALHDGAFYFPLAPEEREHRYQHDLNAYAAARASGQQQAYLDAHFYNVSPVRDDSPFFFNYDRLRNVRLVFQEKSSVDHVRGHWASLMMLSLLSLLSVAVLLFMLLPLLRSGQRGLPGFRLWLLYFCCLGVSFIFVEICLMQRFALLLGHPSRSLALVLASMLFFAGCGSYLKGRASLPLPAVLVWIVLAVLAAAFAYPLAIRLLLPLPLWARGLATAALVAPIALPMGMPFPTGLRLVSEKSAHSVPWMWGVNGGATVLGSILAIFLAMQIGFTAVLTLAAVGYCVALATYIKTPKKAG